MAVSMVLFFGFRGRPRGRLAAGVSFFSFEALALAGVLLEGSC